MGSQFNPEQFDIVEGFYPEQAAAWLERPGTTGERHLHIFPILVCEKRETSIVHRGGIRRIGTQ